MNCGIYLTLFFYFLCPKKLLCYEWPLSSFPVGSRRPIRTFRCATVLSAPSSRFLTPPSGPPAPAYPAIRRASSRRAGPCLTRRPRGRQVGPGGWPAVVSDRVGAASWTRRAGPGWRIRRAGPRRRSRGSLAGNTWPRFCDSVSCDAWPPAPSSQSHLAPRRRTRHLVNAATHVFSCFGSTPLRGKNKVKVHQLAPIIINFCDVLQMFGDKNY
jgi:hypothetical protein